MTRNGTPRPVFSGVAQCPRCFTTDLKIRRKLDKIDFLSSGWASKLQGLLGAKLYHCEKCRFQFYTFKPLAKARGDS